MACDLLIRGIDKAVGDGTLPPEEEMKYSNRKGAVVGCHIAGPEVPSLHLSGNQVPPNWCVVRSDVTVAQVEQYLQPWYPEIDFSRQSLDTAQDLWHGTATAQLIRASDGHGGVTQAQAETFLQGWNVSNLAFSANTAEGDFTIFELATSPRFLGRDLTGLTFESRNYIESTGEHEIRLDYGAVFPAQDAQVLAWIEQRAEVRRQNTGRNDIDYCVWRGVPPHDPTPRQALPGDDMFVAIKEDIEEALNEKIATRRWRFLPAAVDQVMAASPDPGFMEVTPAQLLANLEDVTAL